MSKWDTDFLEELGLGLSEVANALGITRQAVYKGIKSNDDYFNPVRMRKIYDHLIDSESRKAKRLKELVRDEYMPEEADLFQKIFSTRSYGRRAFTEMWLFSETPLELIDANYREAFYKEHYPDNKKTIVYFLPPGESAIQLKNLIDKYIYRLKTQSKSYASIHVFESNGFIFTPHWAIMEPRSAQPKGWILTHDEEFFALINDEIVNHIISKLFACGVGIDDDNFISTELEFKDDKAIIMHDLYLNHLYSSIDISINNKADK